MQEEPQCLMLDSRQINTGSRREWLQAARKRWRTKRQRDRFRQSSSRYWGEWSVSHVLRWHYKRNESSWLDFAARWTSVSGGGGHGGSTGVYVKVHIKVSWEVNRRWGIKKASYTDLSRIFGLIVKNISHRHFLLFVKMKQVRAYAWERWGRGWRQDKQCCQRRNTMHEKYPSDLGYLLKQRFSWV